MRKLSEDPEDIKRHFMSRVEKLATEAGVGFGWQGRA